MHSTCPPSSQLKGLVNQERLLTDLNRLASDQMQGRKVATEGSKLAQNFLEQRFEQIGLRSFADNYRHPFSYGSMIQHQATNLIGWLPGIQQPNQYIVVTAHYDHLGMSGKKIFNGADDNASGVSAMLSLAEFLVKNPNQHSVIFVATDAEEPGLYGSKAFLADPPVAMEKIRLNVNMDMVARGGVYRRLYLAGTRKNPELKQLAKSSARQASVCLKIGHDRTAKLRGTSLQVRDWSKSSDHAPFIKNNIPYVYFGVDQHRDYHKTSDTIENIEPLFFTAAVETIINTFTMLDELEFD